MDNSGNLGIWTFTRNDHEMTQTLDTAGNLPLILVKGTMAGMTKRMESVLKDCASRVGIIVRLAEPPGTECSLLERTPSQARLASTDLILATP